MSKLEVSNGVKNSPKERARRPSVGLLVKRVIGAASIKPRKIGVSHKKKAKLE